jgi:hypothetical protein
MHVVHCFPLGIEGLHQLPIDEALAGGPQRRKEVPGTGVIVNDSPLPVVLDGVENGHEVARLKSFVVPDFGQIGSRSGVASRWHFADW